MNPWALLATIAVLIFAIKSAQLAAENRNQRDNQTKKEGNKP